MRRARDRRTDTFFPPEIDEMTLIYEKLADRGNEWCVRKDTEAIDLSLVGFLQEDEGWTRKKALQTVIEDDELSFDRIDIEIMLLALDVLDKWYEGGDILPVGKYRLNSGYIVRI